METFISQTFEIRKKCEAYSNALGIRFPYDDPRTACFSMILNRTTQTLELLDHYYPIWKEYKTDLSEEETARIREENWQRCVEISRYLFVGAMSVIEFSVRNIISSQPYHPLTQCTNRREKLIEHFDRIYLELDKDSQAKLNEFRQKLTDVPPFDSFRRIIEKSSSIDILGESDVNTWKFLIELRNCTIHNNAVADKGLRIEIDGREFSMEANQMIRGKMDFYIFMTQTAIRLLFNWIQGFDKSREQVSVLTLRE